MTNSPRVGTIFAKADGTPRKVAVLLFDGHTVHDWAGPYSSIASFAGQDVELYFVAKQVGPIRDDSGRATVMATHSFEQVAQADVLLVPGGRQQVAVSDSQTLAWIRRIHDQTEYTVATCTGALILGAANLLRGKWASTVFWERDALTAYGAIYSPKIPAQDGKILTATGFSGAIEVGLRLVEKLAGLDFAEVMQLMLEYDPKPVFGTGNALKAPREVHERASALVQSASAPRPA